ncbi:shikimate 5-dehydrogenase [Nocardiopsis terrae]|uniref:Shikimate dehydrogenase n=1 Tax=Nocardiopsis terrae TaxID=372655 RepID=A0ABR9HEF4_9ACTN|nr:shikimate dehydrogenase [Nocardiopsis terrae]MBE1457415.1 shikimate dehydrogenase [Nocardiopsis terrae]GHC92075.1 shikimate 5-dehydrogenase [Nocardiopsis terrae]
MRAAVLGSPVAHSLSPVLHSAAYTAMGLRDWSYGLFECDEKGLAPFLDGLDPAEWAGLSLTMPLKRRAMELAAEVEDLAAAVGGANTLVRRGAGWAARNTDVAGIARALTEAGAGAPRDAVVLGAGATAASALAALRELGTPGPVTVLARDTGRTGEVTAAAERLGRPVRVAPLAEAPRHLDVDLVLSTLPSGAADAHAEQLAACRADLFDVIYDPWPTVAAGAVAARGGRVVGGFPMLLHQAAAQVRLMTGVEDVPVGAMRAAGEAELARRSAPAGS